MQKTLDTMASVCTPYKNQQLTDSLSAKPTGPLSYGSKDRRSDWFP